MADQKGIGSKILGLFVETGGGELETGDDSAEAGGDREKTAAEQVAELASQVGSGAAVKRAPGPGKPVASGGSPPGLSTAKAEEPLPPGPRLDKATAPAAGPPVDFESIFKTAGMDAAELDRVKKAEELLKGLPETTPLEIKKQIVEASLKAFGFEISKIVLAAQNQKKAIDTYVRVNETGTAKALQDAEAQIQALNDKIAALRADIEKRTAGLLGLNASAQARKAEVQKVIDFFQGPPSPSQPPA